MLKVYFAAKYSRREELNTYRQQLEATGIEVTSRWLVNDPPPTPAELTDDQWHSLAAIDREDVLRADALVAFAEGDESSGGGGRHIEFGIALADSKFVMVASRRENLFHYLPEVLFVKDWDEALEVSKNRSS